MGDSRESATKMKHISSGAQRSARYVLQDVVRRQIQNVAEELSRTKIRTFWVRLAFGGMIPPWVHDGSTMDPSMVGLAPCMVIGESMMNPCMVPRQWIHDCSSMTVSPWVYDGFIVDPWCGTMHGFIGGSHHPSMDSSTNPSMDSSMHVPCLDPPMDLSWIHGAVPCIMHRSIVDP